MPSLTSLVNQFALPGLRFEIGQGGLVRSIVETPHGTGEIYLHGAHIAGWQPAGHRPVLWMSKLSSFESGKPIRGGVPICFPWFGPHARDSSLPSHGRARLIEWELASATMMPEGGIALSLVANIAPFQATFVVQFGKTLKMTLRAMLPSQAAGPQTYEDALHTYFAVRDVRSVSLSGLEEAGYVDKVERGAVKPAGHRPIQVTSEMDRAYFDTTSTCILKDPLLHRTITIRKSGSRSTIVWNPWVDKSARMADFGKEAWPEMLCVETGNVLKNAISIQPGEAHETSATISVEQTGKH